MAQFADHKASVRVKQLVVGDAGSGKTALIASLANAGYNVRILDFDDGLDILWDLLSDEGKKKVNYITLCDDDAKDSKSSAFGRAVKVVYKGWKDGDEDLGAITSWGPEDVLVLDSLTIMSEYAKRAALSGNGKSFTQQLSQADWGDAQRMVINILSYVMSDSVKCNVLVNSHMQFIDEEGVAVARAYPASCGRGISTIVGRYFNNVFRLDAKVRGKEITRTLRTVSDARMQLKNTSPSVLKEEEPADLAAIFEKIKNSRKGS